MLRSQVACAVISLLLFCGCGGGATQEAPERAATQSPSADPTSVTASLPELEAVPQQSEPGDADFPRGSEAFAALVKAAQENDADAWTRAESRLHELGSQATAALSARLDDENSVARELAAMFLAQIGPDAASAAEGLVKLLKDDSTFARVNAAAALTTFDGYAEQAAPILAELLSDTDDNVRLTAATSLRNVGAEGAKSVDRLVRALDDSNAQVRAAVATTLGELGPVAAECLPKLRRLGTDADETVATAAAQAIRKIAESTGDKGAFTIPASATK